MIAAAPPRDSSLGLIRLIFSLAANPTQPVPEELKTYLMDVIKEAKALLSNPNNASPQVNPEAIALALGMKANKELADAVEEITTFESINSVLASKVLEQIKGGYSAY